MNDATCPAVIMIRDVLRVVHDSVCLSLVGLVDLEGGLICLEWWAKIRAF